MMFGEDELPGFSRELRGEVSKQLSLPSENWMQDWPIEVADSARIREFVKAYSAEHRTEHRSAIATLIIASLDDCFRAEKHVPDDLLNSIAAIFRQHADLLGYWECIDSDFPENDFMVTPWIRSLNHRSWST